MTDPLHESPDDTRARALVSLDAALARASIPLHQQVMLRDMVLSAWQEWCAAMQTARVERTPPSAARAAALLLCMNVFWETIVMTTNPEVASVDAVAERLLAQLVGLIRLGPGR